MNAGARDTFFGAELYTRIDSGFVSEERVCEAGDAIPMHRHRDTYIALVLEGSYYEMGIEGIHPGETGVAIYHPPFHAHADRIGKLGARILNIRIPACMPAMAQTSQALEIRPGALASISALAERNPRQAYFATIEELGSVLPPDGEQKRSWVSSARNKLIAGHSAKLLSVSNMAGRSPDHVSRVLKAQFGFSAAKLKGEARVRRVLAHLANNRMTLSKIAHMSNYADQAHMTRDLKRRTGLTPGELRRFFHRGFVQDA